MKWLILAALLPAVLADGKCDPGLFLFSGFIYMYIIPVCVICPVNVAPI